MRDSRDPLAGRRIGIPEARQLDLFADMLERRGAAVIRCPLVDIRDAPDPAPIRAWFDAVLEHGLDDMIWLTGEGVRRLRDFGERESLDHGVAFWRRMAAALARICVAAVGPLVAETLARHDVAVDLIPESNYFMKPLVRALSRHFAAL